MTEAREERFRAIRLTLAALLAVHLVWIEYAVLTRRRFTAFPGGAPVASMVIAFVLGLAIFALLSPAARRSRIVPALLVAAGMFLVFRFDRAEAIERWHARGMRGEQIEALPIVMKTLRELAAAQDQYRLHTGRFATSVEPLRPWFVPPAGATLLLRARGDTGWSAQLRYRSSRCGIWAQDSLLRVPEAPREGVPACDGPNLPVRLGPPVPLVAPNAADRGFSEREIYGSWLQHRGDARRSGIAEGRDRTAAYRWTKRINGELLASPAIAGNQVFVGSQGNGELAALSLDSGTVGFRLRMPNWIHHEPVVTSDLVIVPLGNNENPYRGDTAFGSPPSGVAAYDRRTGVERWRRYTKASVMTSPVVLESDSLVAIVGNSMEAIAWRLRDGNEAWRTRLPNATRMGNPLLVDSLLIIGIEPASVCALSARSGALIYCQVLESGKFRAQGAGHTSPAADGNLVFQTYDRGFPLLSLNRWLEFSKLVVGDSSRPRHTRFTHTGEMTLAALDAGTGRIVWQTPLGPGRYKPVGHSAGTPTIRDGVAYVAATLTGEIVALRVESGDVLWRAPVRMSRGSVLVIDDAVLAATTDSAFVVVDARTGRVRCKQRLPGVSDRAGPTVAGGTAVLTLRNGQVLARPLADWVACRA